MTNKFHHLGFVGYSCRRRLTCLIADGSGHRSERFHLEHCFQTRAGHQIFLKTIAGRQTPALPQDCFLRNYQKLVCGWKQHQCEQLCGSSRLAFISLTLLTLTADSSTHLKPSHCRGNYLAQTRIRQNKNCSSFHCFFGLATGKERSV